MTSTNTSASASAAAAAYPLLDDVRATAARIAPHVLHTPVWRWNTGLVRRELSPATEVWLKLELFQRTGSFKLRGAVNAMLALDDAARARGVVAASAGNHALTVAWTARELGTQARLFMPRTASPARIAACREEGGDVVLTDTVHEAFAQALAQVETHGRTMIHPFDGPLAAHGTATVGLEFMAQVPQLDAVVVPVGGGGLCAGIAAAVKQINPACQVFGVEPEGADAMYRSLLAGEPQKLDRVQTVADSLGAPYTLPYSFGVCRQFVDDVVRVSDDALCVAMHHLHRDIKLVAEPAAAAATAALFGPLRQRLEGRRVGLIVCGSNIDAPRWAELVGRGAAAVA